jgi:GT2 family glycosyltransferase
LLAVFTHRETYLPALLASIRRNLAGHPILLVDRDGPINANMHTLWRALRQTNYRYWAFLDDDIEFLGGDVLHDCAAAMRRNGWAGASIYSTFDPTWGRSDYAGARAELIQAGRLVEREVGWMTGYFMMVDSYQVGHIEPDLDLPDPNTAIDTSYSVAMRAAGFTIGLVPHVCYHTFKNVQANVAVIHTVERYLMAKWGRFYWDNTQYTGCVVEWPIELREQEAPECLL